MNFVTPVLPPTTPTLLRAIPIFLGVHLRLGDNNARDADRSGGAAGQSTGTRVEIPDAVVPGLYLIVQPTGVKSWAVRYRVGRRTRKLTFPGRYPVLSLAKARDAARRPWRVFQRVKILLPPSAQGRLRTTPCRVHSVVSRKTCQHGAAGHGGQYQP